MKFTVNTYRFGMRSVTLAKGLASERRNKEGGSRWKKGNIKGCRQCFQGKMVKVNNFGSGRKVDL